MTAEGRVQGRLFVISAPSGAGKSTLVKALLEVEPRLRFSVSYTTRRAREHEVDGRDYFFIDDEKFADMIRHDEFLEYALVFDHWYGTGRRHVEGLIADGHLVLLEIDWQGAQQVRKRMPEVLSIFVLPPSVAELERRLRGRASDSEEVIARRLSDAMSDMSHWHEFDYVIVNDDLATSVAELHGIVRGQPTIRTTADEAVRRTISMLVGRA
jgi:guanylate kinase